jgi:hypothetical protein
LLQWKDVDLARRFITVKTAKTGQTVTIPIFPLLLDELASLPASNLDLPSGKDLVFPDQAAMYEENPDGITWRVKKVLAVALGGIGTEEKGEARRKKGLADVSEDEARRRLPG